MKNKVFVTVLIVSSLTMSACSQLEGRFGKISPGDALSIGADAYKAATLSDEDTAQMAHKVAVEMDRTNEIAPAQSPYTKRLTKLVAQYGNEDGLKLNYKVYIDPEVNAFSLADGTIRVYSGLMDLMNDQEVLFVIGHEIGHIKSGHSKTRMQRAYAASAVTGAAGASLSSAGAGSLGGAAVAVGGEILTEMIAMVIKAQFSQSDEIESDQYGVKFLHRHGNQPGAAVDALNKLGADESGDGEASMAQFTSTHPNSKERVEGVQEVLAQLGDVPVENKTMHAKSQPVSAEPEAQAVQVASAGTVQTTAVQTKSAKMKVSTEPTVAKSDSVGAGWYIQLAAFHEPTQAESMKGALVERSERAKLQSTVVKGNQYERVLVGPYPTKLNAAVELDRVISHGIFEGEPFVRRLPE